jgi:multiple antibiotic resistance protein
MNDYFSTTVFFTLFFIIDPLGLLPVFLVYTAGYDDRMRHRIIIKTTAIAFFVSLFFILFGSYLLKYLSISTASFLIAGGVLLFIISMEMLLGRPSRIKMRNMDEGCPPLQEDTDVSVFPLAIPMLCGPGNIAALLMFRAQAGEDFQKLLILIGLTFAVFLICMIIMFFTKPLGKFFGKTGISIIQRIIGLILSALAIQFIKNGLVTLNFVAS